MQQVQISDKGAIVCYMYFNPYYLATAPISKYPLHQSTHTFVLTTFLCCWVRLWFLLKLTFSIVYIITIQSLMKTKLKVFRSFISMLYKVHKIHAVMYRCIILVINSAIRELYFAFTCTIPGTYFSWEAIWEDKQFLMIPYLIGRKLD